jgi:hypothetical protein
MVPSVELVAGGLNGAFGFKQPLRGKVIHA